MIPSPLLDLPGAVAAAGAESGVAAHYGHPVTEQRRWTSGDGVVDLSARGVVTVTGPDRLSWLHSLTTQHLKDLEPGASAEALILGPTGHIEHAVHIIDDGATSWLTVEPGASPAVTGWLDSMRFMLRVEVADRSSEFAVLASPTGFEGHLCWRDPWPGPVGDTASYGPVEGHPGQEWQLVESLVPRAGLSSVVCGRELVGIVALEALRVAAWRPRAGLDTDHRTIAHELDWLRTAVHLHKGCYRGQETVARVHNLGRPPRRLAFFHLDGSGHELPAPGSGVYAGQRQVGRVTSVGLHHEDGPIALGVVKRSTPVDVELVVRDPRCGDIAAAQTVIVAP